MAKTFKDAMDEYTKAKHNLLIEVAKALKIDALLNFLSRLH
jgi:hypothetical protein